MTFLATRKIASTRTRKPGSGIFGVADSESGIRLNPRGAPVEVAQPLEQSKPKGTPSYPGKCNPSNCPGELGVPLGLLVLYFAKWVEQILSNECGGSPLRNVLYLLISI